MASTVKVTGTLSATLSWIDLETENRGPTGEDNTITDNGKVNYVQNFATGVGGGQTDQVWHDVRTLSSGGVEQFDLTSLSQTILGGSLTKSFSKVKALLIENKSTVGDIGVSMTGATAFNEPMAYPTGTIKIPIQSPFLIGNYQTGWTVDGTNKIFQVHDVDGSGATYHIAVIGNV